jgi:hypothetical protein
MCARAAVFCSPVRCIRLRRISGGTRRVREILESPTGLTDLGSAPLLHERWIEVRILPPEVRRRGSVDISLPVRYLLRQPRMPFARVSVFDRCMRRGTVTAVFGTRMPGARCVGTAALALREEVFVREPRRFGARVPRRRILQDARCGSGPRQDRRRRIWARCFMRYRRLGPRAAKELKSDHVAFPFARDCGWAIRLRNHPGRLGAFEAGRWAACNPMLPVADRCEAVYGYGSGRRATVYARSDAIP